MKKLFLILKCVLWYGEHQYTPISPEDQHGRQLGECVVPKGRVDVSKEEQERIVFDRLRKGGVLRTLIADEGDGVLVKTSFIVPADNFQKWIDERQRMLESAKAASELYCQKKGGAL